MVATVESLKNQLQKLAPAGLMLGLACNRLANVLADDDMVWRLHDITLSACFAFAALWALQLVPYASLRLKCAAAVVAGAAVVDLLCVVLSIPGYWYWLVAQVVAGIGLASFYFLRSYDQPSDPIDDAHLFCLRSKPESLQDFLIAMLGVYGPSGGYSLYANGIIYRYRRGELVAKTCAGIPPLRYHVTRGKPITGAMIRELKFLVGSKWSLRNNCLTVLGPLWRKHRG